jgi:hypothetical protein
MISRFVQLSKYLQPLMGQLQPFLFADLSEKVHFVLERLSLPGRFHKRAPYVDPFLIKNDNYFWLRRQLKKQIFTSFLQIGFI